jgi:hypothetical protein
MPEPRGPQQGQQNEDLDKSHPAPNIDQGAQEESQSKPGDRDRYPDPDKRAQEEEEGHQDDRDALENEIERDDQAGKERTDKQAGQMLENPGSQASKSEN